MNCLKSIIYAGLTVATACLLVISTGNIAMAAVSGECYKCHTMHNSQAGTGDEGGPSAFLVKTTDDNICVGCHTGDAAAGINAPLIDTDLPLAAGGKFSTDDVDDSKTHNVLGLNSVDETIEAHLGYEPPGWAASGDRGAHESTSWASNTLTCAGTYGCHGNIGEPNVNLAIKGAHHTNDDSRRHATGWVDAATTVGDSYRFLNEVIGKEATINVSNIFPWTSNNYWAGSTGKTISELCAECHGDFHDLGADTDTSDTGNSPFKRHPTDRAIDTNNNTGLEEDLATLAGILPVGWSSVNTADRKYAICQSCHYSHGSAYNDILRFDYSDQLAGNGSSTDVGCEACHVRQR